MNTIRPAILLACLLPGALLAGDKDAAGFLKFDRNGDQVVTYFEFAHRKREEFRALDRSQDNLLTQGELDQAAKEDAGRHDPFALCNFSDLDRDQDHFVTMAEYGYAVGLAFSLADGAADGERDERVTLAEYLAALNRARGSEVQVELVRQQVAQKSGAPDEPGLSR